MASAAVAFCVLVVSGCAPEVSRTQPQPSKSSTPAFRWSRTETANTARQIYGRYLKTSVNPSKKNVADFSTYVTGTALVEEKKSLSEISARGLRLQGHVDLDKFTTQQFNSATGEISAYVCIDLGAVRVINKGGEDVTPSDRIDRQTALAVFRRSAGKLKLAEDNEWSGKSVC